MAKKGDERSSQTPGSEAILKFRGVALALLGDLNQSGGRATIYLDGNKAGLGDAYIVDRIYDNVLWSVGGLKPGEHTLRLVTTAGADPRSTGRNVSLKQTVVYRAAATSDL